MSSSTTTKGKGHTLTLPPPSNIYLEGLESKLRDLHAWVIRLQMSVSQAGFRFLALQQAFRDYRSQLEDIHCAIIRFHDEAWILPTVAMLLQLSYLSHDYGLEFEHWRYSPEAIDEFFREHGVRVTSLLTIVRT
ncbi:hypothetical protein E1B28_008365 [Marasmius oreades]|uniref:Uncharacterized protein n=1 Tax=Marasmius oreades TaxID=181124 RepID=A0A9P7RYD7_9AGAR|nr:uncharacterized protein E1B28_008365 [Marasmius oreades]KAG7091977.1 hypothetical protein E1B28_008365 [Marasmius oreades]